MDFRIGFGEDAHKLEVGRPLIIGGVEVESERGAAAHSDGDVLLHALADAFLSSHALGDIGLYFPPPNPDFKDLNSAEIVRRVLGLLREHGPLEIGNAAIVITLDKPKLGPYREQIQKNVAKLLEVDPQNIGVGFKTSEGLSPGHIQARATVLLGAKPYTSDKEAL